VTKSSGIMKLRQAKAKPNEPYSRSEVNHVLDFNRKERLIESFNILVLIPLTILVLGIVGGYGVFGNSQNAVFLVCLFVLVVSLAGLVRLQTQKVAE